MCSKQLRFLLLLALSFVPGGALADISTNGVLDEVAHRFLTESASWAEVITDYATWLFWTLGTISLVWTGGTLVLKQADIREFFAEFVRFIITFGFFLWLLRNGPAMANSVIDSLRMIGAEAGGLPRELTPSEPISIAFDIIIKAAEAYSFASPIDNLSIFLITLAIFACMAVVAANVLLALISAWILIYAGVFVLGFGGSNWTSDIAINYFKTVLAVALKLMTMTLLIGIATSIMDGFYAELSNDAPMDELLVIFVVSLVLLLLIHSIPNVVAGLIPHGGSAVNAGSVSVGSFISGALAGGSMVTGVAAGAAMSAMGGASAIHAAFKSAQSAASQGITASFDAGNSSDGMEQSESSGSAFAEASGSSEAGGLSRAGQIALGTAGNLVKGMGSMAKSSVSGTTGGRLADAIRSNSAKSNGGDAAGSLNDIQAGDEFEGNSIGEASWVDQSGGFDSLSPQQQEDAREAHGQWQASNPTQQTSDLRSFVSRSQERQRERNEEIASFVNQAHVTE
ncbi:P-type conjugative transfer protein TrbL [Shewanella corallii]|uniref:P-type conjugative transfer protein TrbL n=1 Tax=Shewanella corallii TaxID=560080 RepID=A0ABT0N3K2_9GAMM|nr:P-type conjugative transfer protein TrbL [Shewanella corallii]MCL2913024.1 P-type conjugative transfer protein TrbL [Shewanella corallii]